MATHSSVFAWGIPGMGEPGGLPSIGSHRVRHDWSDLAAAAACLVFFFNHKIPIHRHSSALTVERLFCGSAVRHWGSRELQAAGEYPLEPSNGPASRSGIPNYDPRPIRAEPRIYNSQAKNYFYIFKQSLKKKRQTMWLTKPKIVNTVWQFTEKFLSTAIYWPLG